MDIGTLRYSPKMLGNRVSENWWLIVDLDPELVKYYRHLYHINTYRCHKLIRPAWEAHISVVRNEEPVHKQFWEAHAGEKVEVEIHSELHTNGEYFWLDVACPRLYNIREELGLPREPYYPFHLSIGHNK